MWQKIVADGVKDVQFVAINGISGLSPSYQKNIINKCSFPVLQDTKSAKIWPQLNGKKHDAFVYDKTGKLILHWKAPWSINFSKFQSDIFNALDAAK